MNTMLPTDIRELDQTIAAMDDFHNRNYRSSMEAYKSAVSRLAALHGVEKYDVVFIGEPGMGKTTAICTWLGLVKKDVSKASSIEDAMLLCVHQGRTTVAEVRIRQVEGRSRIHIDYGSREAQESMIKDYCRFYYCSLVPSTEDDEDEEEDDDASFEAHSEVDRVVRNMAGLHDIPKEGTESREKALRALEKLGSFESFLDCVMRRIGLENRDLSEIAYDGRDDFESWLSTNFEAVNYGKNPRCGIADRITIEIGKDDLDLRLPGFVGDIVDTKGLDTSSRMDLQDLMTSDDTVCILMDRLNSVPTVAVRSIVKKAFPGREFERYAMKTLLLVRCSDDNLAAVNEAEGDPEIGKEKKLNEIERRIDSERLVMFGRNAVFLDSHSPFETRKAVVKDSDGKGKPRTVLTGYNTEIAGILRQQVEDGISSAIGFLRRSLEDEAEQIRGSIETLMKLEEDFESTCGAKELEEIRRDLEGILENGDYGVDPDGIVDVVVGRTVDDIHWRSLRKMNSEYGAYGGYGGRTDTYTQVRQAGREAFYECAEGLSRRIRKSFLEQSTDDGVEAVLGSYLKSLDAIVLEETRRTTATTSGTTSTAFAEEGTRRWWG